MKQHQPYMKARIKKVLAGFVAVAVLASALLFMPVAAGSIATSQALPGTSGAPQEPSVVYTEDFENVPGNAPVLLSDYTGKNNQTYTADAPWLTSCNGQIVNFNIPVTMLGNCADVGNTSPTRQLSYALGAHSGMGAPELNNAVTAYTAADTGADLVEFQTISNIALGSSSGRFLTFSVDTAAQNCWATAPLYQFSFLNSSGAGTDVGDLLNACSSTKTVVAPAVGDRAEDTISVGTYTPNGSLLFNDANLGIQMRNVNGSGFGNDAAFDNIRILDVTPQLDKSFSPAAVATGGASILAFTVTNTSELASKNGWSFTDALPAGLTVAAAPAAATDCPAGVVTAAPGSTSVAAAGNLDAGQAACTVTVAVTSPVTGSFTNGPDNVTTTGLNAPGTSTVIFEAPELTMAKNAADAVDVNGNGITDAGDTIAYTFDVTNTGDVAVANLAISDPMVGAVTCPVTTLAVDGATTCAAGAVYTVTAADAIAGAVNNTATATGTSPAGTPITSTPSSTTTPAEAPAPALLMEKSVSPANEERYNVGQEITYSFAVTNTGNVPVADLAIEEGTFTGTGALSAPNCPAAPLAPAASATCTATYVLAQADIDNGSVSNTAFASGIPTGSNVPVESPNDTVELPTPPVPGISIVKTATPGTVTEAGQAINYSFVVTNTGNVTLTDIAVDDTDFSGTGELSALECPATALASGEVITCTASYTATQADVDAGSITNSATATGTTPGGGQLTPVPSEPVIVQIPAAPSLEVGKSASLETFSTPGEDITYEFLVTNTGNVTLSDVNVIEGEFSGSGELSQVVCPESAASLAPGTSVTCTASYTTTQADVDAGGITNTATSTGTPPGDGSTPPPVSPPSEINIPGTRNPKLTLVKTASADEVKAAGQGITYSFLLTNTGNVTLSNVTAVEGRFTGTGALSAVACPEGAALLAPGASVTCAASYTATAADLVAGTISNTATGAAAVPGGDSMVSAPSMVKVATVAPAAAPVEAALANTGLATGPVVLSSLLVLLLGGGSLALAKTRRREEV